MFSVLRFGTVPQLSPEKKGNEKMRRQKKERSHQITPFADNIYQEF